MSTPPTTATAHLVTQGAWGGTAEAAQALGVSRRTVQRWLAGDPGQPARIPAARWEQLHQSAAPSTEQLQTEQDTARLARRDALVVGTRVRSVEQDHWAQNGWDKHHAVVVIRKDIPAGALFQIALYRPTHSKTLEINRRGEVIDLVLTPSKFHAQLVVHRVLSRRAQWRITARRWFPRGWTQVWTDGAPTVHLNDELYLVLTDLETDTPGGTHGE